MIRSYFRVALRNLVKRKGYSFLNIFGLAMRFGITASQIRENIYTYPTFSSDIKHMLGHG